MRYIATAQYRTEFTEPIVLAPGDVIRIVQELDADYPGWFLCVTDDGSQAWVPAGIVERDSDDRGTVTQAYTNRELDVDPGDAVDGEREVLGWLWATNTRTGKVGWVPLDNVRPLAAG